MGNKMIYSREIIEELSYSCNLGEKEKELIEGHLSLKEIEEGEYLVFLKRFYYDDVEKILNNNIQLFFDVSYDVSGKVLRSLTSDFISTEEFRLMQKKRASEIWSNQKNLVQNPYEIHGLVVATASVLKSLIIWVSKNK